MSKDKFLPHIDQILQATQQLPDAVLWPEEQYVAVIEGSRHNYELVFHRIPYVSRAEGKTHRWAYRGTIRVN